MVKIAATLVMVIVAVWAWLKLPLWRDTIVRCEQDGILVMASGKEYPLNRWFRNDGGFEFSRLQIRSAETGVLIHYIVENYDDNAKAKLRIGGSQYLALHDGSRWKSTNHWVEHFVSRGAESEDVEQAGAQDP